MNEINPADEVNSKGNDIIQSQGNDEGNVEKATPKRTQKKTLNKTPNKTPKTNAKKNSSLNKKIPKTTMKRKEIKKTVIRKSARLMQQNKEAAAASGTRSLLSESDMMNLSVQLCHSIVVIVIVCLWLIVVKSLR